MRLLLVSRAHVAVPAMLLVLAGGVVALSGPRVPGYDRLHGDDRADAIAAGRLLIGELNCTACHAADAAQSSLLSRKEPPVLDSLAQRVRPDYLAKFLADPHAVEPGTTMPSVLHGVEGIDAVLAAEQLAHFLASQHPAGPAQSNAAIGARARGDALYHTVGCVACHGPRKEGAEPVPHVRPLGDLEAKYTLPSLAAFLQDPLHVRPSGRMPSLNLFSPEAHDVAAFLLPGVPEKSGLAYKYYEGSWNRMPDFDALEPKAAGTAVSIDVRPRRRNESYGLRFEGSLRLDAKGEYRFWLKSDDGSTLKVNGKMVVDNDGVHGAQEKTGTITLARGSHLVVVEMFQAGGEAELSADFSGPGLARRRLDAAVISAQPEVPLAPTGIAVDAEKARAGRELFVRVGCASCHVLREQPEAAPLASTLAALPLARLNPGTGCLSESPGKAAPRYALSDDQRRAIAAALTSLAEPAPLAPAESVRGTFTRLNCYACHQRDSVGGVADEANAWFQGTQPEMGDEGRVPPPLDGVGGKLTGAWLEHVLTHGASDRPYMLARMPKFGADNAGHLQPLLAELDKLPPLPPVELPPAEAKLAGWRMVGEQGFGCIKCHTFGHFKSTGVQSMDMTTMSKRLRPEWFRRYLDDPQLFRPGTRMPDSWPGDGDESLLPDILDGKKQTQIQAVWNYLNDGPRARTPSGLASESMELIPTYEPIIYRNFIEGAGTRAIGVGYPEHLSLAFDANDLRLALVWQGRFIDASRHWSNRGEGFEPPAGTHVLALPPHATFARLASVETAWPTRPAREVGLQFRGYRLAQDGRPTFRYSLGAISIEDFPRPGDESAKVPLVRQFTVTAEGPVDDLYLRAAVGSAIKPLADGWYEIDDRLRVRVGGGQVLVRSSGGKQELLVRAVFEGRQATLTQEYDW